jgi:hypothetical protein
MADERGAGPPDWQSGDPGFLAGKTETDLDVMEHEGRAAVLEHVRRRDPKTHAVQNVPVRVWPPTHLEKVKARIEALGWLQQIAKLSSRPTWKEAEELVGHEYIDQLDTVCLLARCARDEDAPEHQHMHYEDLDRHYGRASLLELWERVGAHAAEQDPRITELDEDRFWELLLAIDKMKSVLPLVVLGGDERDSFVLTMASRLASSRKRSSSSPSTET